MGKRLICWLWGHDTVRKAYTGQMLDTVGQLGNRYTVSLYKWEKSKFCLRCGKEAEDG